LRGFVSISYSAELLVIVVLLFLALVGYYRFRILYESLCNSH